MGTISVAKSPECDQGFMRPPAEERKNSATRVDCHTPTAERLADHSQVEDSGGDGYGLSPTIRRTPGSSYTRRPPRYLNEYIRCVRSNVFSSDDETMKATTKRRFRYLVCPVQITGLRNLKRHYFERHKLVPTEIFSA